MFRGTGVRRIGGKVGAVVEIPCGAVGAATMQGVLRLRICFASQSKFLAQDDMVERVIKT
jgi:hypothetical protein